MEKMNYEGLLNKVAIRNSYRDIIACLIVSYNLYKLISLGFALIAVALLLSRAYKVFMESNEINNRVLLYNDYVEKTEFSLVEEELLDEYSTIAKTWILYKYASIWEPEFLYLDKDQVYKSAKDDIYIASGYFKDVKGYKDRKVKYSIIFKDDEYYMSNIDNLVLLKYKKSATSIYSRDNMYNKWSITLICATISVGASILGMLL